MTTLARCVADRWMKNSKRAEHWLGVNVSSWETRFVSEQDQLDQWWIDLESLVKGYWSLQKIQTGQSSSQHMWARLYGRSGPLEIQFLGGPKRLKVLVQGGKEIQPPVTKTFGGSASLKDIMMWVDKMDRSFA